MEPVRMLDTNQSETMLSSWDKLIAEIITDFDANELMFNEVKNLSNSPLGPMASNVKDGRQYFDLLINNLGPEDCLDFLINLMEYSNFHQDLYFGGEKMSKRLSEHKVKLERHKRECMRKNIYNENFVGREDDINKIEKIFEPKSPYKGVSLYGMGGIGKTCLANEVCRRLWASSKHWRIKKIDLREKKTVFDLLRDTLIELDDLTEDIQSLMKELTEEILKTRLFRNVEGIKQRTLLLFDNCDEILERENENFLKFTNEFLHQIQQTSSCKVQVIFTSRVEPELEPDLSSRLLKHEVKALTPDQAVTLFEKCTRKDQANSEEKKEIVSLCSYIPLAIRTVCSTLKSEAAGLSPSEMIRLIKREEETNSCVGMEDCLQQTFQRLDKTHQVMLLQLCLFKTSAFDIEAASNLLLETQDADSKPRTRFHLLHLRSRHLLEIHDQALHAEDNEIKEGKSFLYSIHPLVCNFLKTVERSDSKKEKPEFKKSIQDSKIRFVNYFRGCLSDIAKSMDLERLRAHRIFAEQRVHIISFYDALETIDLPQSTDYLQNRRISEFRELCINDNTGYKAQLAMFDRFINNAKRNNSIQNEIFWYTEKGLKLIQMQSYEDIPQTISETEDVVATFEKQCRSDEQRLVMGKYYFLVGRYYHHIDDKPKAKLYLERAWKWYDKIPKENLEYTYVVDIANVSNSIGCCLFNLDNDEALKYHKQAWDLCYEHKQGPLHIDSNAQTFFANLASCYFEKGSKSKIQKERKKHLEEAKSCYTHALNMDKAVNMDDRDMHAIKLMNRSVVLMSLGEMESAEEDVKEALKIWEKVLPPKHPKITKCYARIGEIKWNLAKEIKEKDIDQFYDLTLDAKCNFTKVKQLINEGGLSCFDERYHEIKKVHLKVLKTYGDTQEYEETELFYAKYAMTECEPEREYDGDMVTNSIGNPLTSEENDSDSDTSLGRDIDAAITSDSGSSDLSNPPSPTPDDRGDDDTKQRTKSLGIPDQSSTESDIFVDLPSSATGGEFRFPPKGYRPVSMMAQPTNLRSDGSSCSASLSTTGSVTDSSVSSPLEENLLGKRQRDSKRSISRQNAMHEFVGDTLNECTAARRNSYKRSSSSNRSTDSIMSASDYMSQVSSKRRKKSMSFSSSLDSLRDSTDVEPKSMEGISSARSLDEHSVTVKQEDLNKDSVNEEQSQL